MSVLKRRRTAILTVRSQPVDPAPTPPPPLLPSYLCNMPDDILAHIAEHLTLANLWCLSQVSRRFRSAAYLSIRRQYDLDLTPRCPEDTDEFVVRLRRSLLSFDEEVNGALVSKIVRSIWDDDENPGKDDGMEIDSDDDACKSSSAHAACLRAASHVSPPPRTLRHRIKTAVLTLVQFGSLPLHPPTPPSSTPPSSAFAWNTCLVLEKIAARANGARGRNEAGLNLPHVPTLLTRCLAGVLDELAGRIARLVDGEARQCNPSPYIRVARVKLYRRLEHLFLMIGIFHTTFEIPTTADVQKYVHILCHRIFLPLPTTMTVITTPEPDKYTLGFRLRILERLRTAITTSGRHATDTTPLGIVGGVGLANVVGAGQIATPTFALSHPPPSLAMQVRDRLRRRELVKLLDGEVAATARLQTAQVTRYVMRHGELMRQMIYHYPSMRKGAEKIIAALETKIGALREHGDRPDAVPMEHFRDFWTAILRDTAGYSIAPVPPLGDGEPGVGSSPEQQQQEYRTPLVVWTKEQVDAEGDRFMAYLEGCVR